MTKTIGIIAVKGGVGKTTTVANLAAVLSNTYNKRVLAVDANYSAPNLGLHLGLIDPVHSLHDVLLDKVDIKNAIINHKLGFDILPSSLQPKKINPYKLKNRLDKIKSDYDVILLDSSPTQNEEMLSSIVAADELVLVTSPDFPSLSCTLASIKASKNKKIKGIIINKSLGKKFEISPQEIEATTGIKVLGTLTHDVKSLEALSKQVPLALHKPRRKLSKAYRNLAATLMGEEPVQKNIFSFFKKTTKQSLDVEDQPELPEGLEHL